MTTETGTFTPTDACAHPNRVTIYSRERSGPDYYCPDCGLDSNPPPEPPVFTAAEVRDLIERERRAAKAEALREAAQRGRDSVDDGGAGACWPSELDEWADEIEREVTA